MKKKAFILALIISACFSAISQKSEVFTVEGKAIRGFDPVAYFTQGKPAEGNPKFSYSWKDGIWQFVSDEHLQTFKKNPEKYAPQYGGYCAFGLANGYKAPTDTDAWTIVEGKLYLNYNNDVRKMWNQKQGDFINKADRNWPAVKGKG